MYNKSLGVLGAGLEVDPVGCQSHGTPQADHRLLVSPAWSEHRPDLFILPLANGRSELIEVGVRAAYDEVGRLRECDSPRLHLSG